MGVLQNWIIFMDDIFVSSRNLCLKLISGQYSFSISPENIVNFWFPDVIRGYRITQ